MLDGLRAQARAPDEVVVVVHDSDVVTDRLAGVRPGDEVIMPSFTFVSTATAVGRAGGRPVFVGIGPRTLNIDPAAAAAAIGPRTRALQRAAHVSAVRTLDDPRFGEGCELRATGDP